MKNAAYRDLFSGNIDVSLRTGTNILAAYPASAAALLAVGRELTHARDRRLRHAAEGVEVPAMLIVSTTDACNLSCAGCYACARDKRPDNALPDGRIAEVLDEASALGVGVVMLAGGEPLLSHGWLDAMGRHDEMLGIVFTNGTLFDAPRRAWFADHRHMIPVFSIEGDERQTDERRGAGVYAKVAGAMRELSDGGIPFGVSITVTNRNLDSVLDDAYATEHLQTGCRLFFFVEYVPVERGSEPMALSADGKRQLNDRAARLAAKYPALFIPFPGDEEEYGGCLAAGRGFVHVSAGGDVEPCPFAPFSDTNLANTSLRDALASGFLAKVRRNHHLLKEGDGGCALWHNRGWLSELLRED